MTDLKSEIVKYQSNDRKQKTGLKSEIVKYQSNDRKQKTGVESKIIKLVILTLCQLC